jgi:hypothetical protein
MTGTSFIDKLIYQKDKENPQTYLKGQFFVWSTLLFFVLCFSSIIYYPLAAPHQIGPQIPLFIFNVIFTAGILALLWVYKKYGGRVIMVNIMTSLGFLGSFAALEGGGIYAPDNMWGFLISAWVFLVANRISGIIWMVLTVIEYIVFYCLEVQGIRDFHSDAAKTEAVYYFINLVLGSIFLLVIMHLHEKSKEKFAAIILSSKNSLFKK